MSRGHLICSLANALSRKAYSRISWITHRPRLSFRSVYVNTGLLLLGRCISHGDSVSYGTPLFLLPLLSLCVILMRRTWHLGLSGCFTIYNSMSFHFKASLPLIYPEDSTSVPGRADVDVIIFRSVLSWPWQRKVGNAMSHTARR